MRLSHAVIAIAAYAISAGAAAAQTASVVDPAKIATLESRMRGNIYARLLQCDLLVPSDAGHVKDLTRTALKQSTNIAQACWNVFPSVTGAVALDTLLNASGDAAAGNAIIAAAEQKYAGQGELFVALAGRKARAGDVPGANALMDSAIAKGPSSGNRDPDNWAKLAAPLIEGDNIRPLRLRIYDEAWKRAEARNDRDEKVRALRSRGALHLSEDRFAEALADAERAMPFTGKSDRHDILLLRARAKKALGDAAGGAADFAAALADDVSVASSELFYRRAQAEKAAPSACRLAASRKYQIATSSGEDLDQVMEAGDECIAAGQPAMGLTLKASERVRIGDRTAANTLLDEAIAADPNYAYAHAVRAANLSAADKTADAVAALNKAVELEASVPEFYFERAALHARLGDKLAARADYERGLGIDPRSDDDINAYVQTLIALGDHRCALSAIDDAPPSLSAIFGDATIQPLRATVNKEVRKLPQGQRACSTPLAYGNAFVF